MNHQLGQLVTDVTDYSLFLSATPINLRANDLRALLKLIDPDTFEREYLFDILQEENVPLLRAWEAARDTRVRMHELRTEERRVGKEGVHTCISLWVPGHENNKNIRHIENETSKT